MALESGHEKGGPSGPPFSVSLTKGLLHQKRRAGTLDLPRDLAVEVGGESGHAAGKDLSGFRRELAKQFGVLEVDRVGRNIEATTGHAAVGLAKIAAALGCLGCAHGGDSLGIRLLGLPMKRMALQVRVVLLLFKASGSAEALLVSRGDVTGDGLAFGNGLRAFENDDIAWHGLVGFGTVIPSCFRMSPPLLPRIPPRSIRRAR